MKNNGITSEERDEYIDMLREAQSKLYEALETMRYVQRATENNHAYKLHPCAYRDCHE